MTSAAQAADRSELEQLRADRERMLREDWRDLAALGPLEEYPGQSMLSWVKLTTPGYAAGWFHLELAAALERFSAAVAQGRSPRLMIFAPPRHGKTEQVSVKAPVKHMAENPGHEVVCASYGQDLADDNSRKARTTARGDDATWVFPDIRPVPAKSRYRGDYQRNDVDRVQRWAVGNGSTYTAVGVGGPLTGRGFHFGVIDDPIKDAAEASSKAKRDAVWDWYLTTFRTRCAPGGGIILMLTRWHEDDLAGRLLKKAKEDPEADQWEVLSYPAIAEADEPHRRAGEALHPARWPLQELLKLKAAMTDRFGERWWLALYQQRPTAATGDLFKRGMPTFSRFYVEHPADTAARADRVFLSIDANFKETDGGSYGCARVIAQIGSNFHVVDEYRARAGYSSFKAGCKALAGKYPTISVTLIEDKANGSAMIDELSGELPNVIAYDKGAKSKREAWELWLVPAAESGSLWLPDPKHAPWVHDCIEEYIAARGEKSGEVNDRIDCDCQVLAYVRSHDSAGASWLDVFAGEAHLMR
jgi:phage terminase large subunit-like protein